MKEYIENQESVCRWCNEHYPDETKKTSVFNLLEEVIELAVAAGVEINDINRIASISYNKSVADLGKSADVPKELGDVQISLYSLAGIWGYDALQCCDEKMASNRERSTDESKARLEAKKNKGLR